MANDKLNTRPYYPTQYRTVVNNLHCKSLISVPFILLKDLYGTVQYDFMIGHQCVWQKCTFNFKCCVRHTRIPILHWNCPLRKYKRITSPVGVLVAHMRIYFKTKATTPFHYFHFNFYLFWDMKIWLKLVVVAGKLVAFGIYF